jgi:hypothetical protein
MLSYLLIDVNPMCLCPSLPLYFHSGFPRSPVRFLQALRLCCSCQPCSMGCPLLCSSLEQCSNGSLWCTHAPVADGPHQPPCKAPPRALARVVARVRSDWASSPRPSARSTDTSSVKAPAETAKPTKPAGQSALSPSFHHVHICMMV